jgi:hypothetical protein
VETQAAAAAAAAADAADADVRGAEKTPIAPVALVGWHHETGLFLLERRACL